MCAMRKPDLIAKALGLQGHPLCIKANENHMPSRGLRSVLQRVMYSLDAESQYTCLQTARKKRKVIERLQARAAGKVEARPRGIVTIEGIRAAAIAGHAQTCLEPGMLYSMPRAVVSAAVVPSGPSSHHRLPHVLDTLLELDIATEPASPVADHRVAQSSVEDERCRGSVFFRVI